MATTPQTTSRPLTQDAFVADRQAFLSSFLNFTTGAVAFVVVVLILLAIFLT